MCYLIAQEFKKQHEKRVIKLVFQSYLNRKIKYLIFYIIIIILQCQSFVLTTYYVDWYSIFMKKSPAITVKGKLNHLAYQQLKAMIVSGEASQEKPLVERTISKKLHMSRTPIKHAISRLQQEGLIRVVPRHGVFPVIITYAEYKNIIEIREFWKAWRPVHPSTIFQLLN